MIVNNAAQMKLVPAHVDGSSTAPLLSSLCCLTDVDLRSNCDTHLLKRVEIRSEECVGKHSLPARYIRDTYPSCFALFLFFNHLFIH